MDDQERVAQSFVLTFYTNVQNVKTHYASFSSLLLQLENMYPQTKQDSFFDMSDIPEEHKNQILDVNNNMRFYIQTSYFDFLSMTDDKGIKCSKELRKKIMDLYAKMKKNLFIERDDVEDYILKLNKFLISDIMKQLVDQAQNFINNLYENDRTSTQ